MLTWLLEEDAAAEVLVIKAAEVGLTGRLMATVALLLIQVLADMGRQWVGRLPDLLEDLLVGTAEAEAATAATLNVKALAGMMTGTASVLVTRYPTFSSWSKALPSRSVDCLSRRPLHWFKYPSP